MILQMVKQQRSEDCSEYLVDCHKEIRCLTELGYISSIKGNKKDSAESKLRTTKAGEELLQNIEIPEIIEEDLTLFEWVKNIYLSKDKKLGNQKKTKLYIALFRAHSGIDRNKLATLLSIFVEDEQNMAYSHILEYIFYRPANVYATKFTLLESRLYNYYLDHQEFFDEKFNQIDG
jgi:hypothetical protein